MARVNPLTWNVPIVDANGFPTPEFQAKWLQQEQVNQTIPDLSAAAKVSDLLDLIGSTQGSLLIRGASAWQELETPGGTTKFLRADGTYAVPDNSVSEDDINLSDVLTNNVSTTRHGFAPKLPNDSSKYLDGTGQWTTPAGGGGGGGAAWTIAKIWDHDVDGTTLSFDVTDLDDVNDLFVALYSVTRNPSGSVRMRLSTDNGSTFFDTSGNYIRYAGDGSGTPADSVELQTSSTGTARHGFAHINGLGLDGIWKTAMLAAGGVNFVASTDPVNAIRIYTVAAGGMTGGRIVVMTR